MIDRAHDIMRSVPMVDHSARVSSVGRLIVAASTLVAVVIALLLIQRSMSGPFLLGLLLILAIIGVIALFGGAIGLFGLAGRGHGQTMTRAFVDAAPEGVLVTDRDGRIIYANRAYADLMGAANERDVRAIERLFSGDASAAEAIYRLAQSVREGRSAEEEVRLTIVPSGDGGAVAVPDLAAQVRWFRIRARPLAAPTGQKALTAWTVADISQDRAR